MVATLYRHPDGLGQIRIDAARMCIEIVNEVDGTRASAAIGPRGLIALAHELLAIVGDVEVSE